MRFCTCLLKVVLKSPLDFRKTMCATTAEQEAQWTVDTGLLIRDFGMDPFQDLLVLVRNQPTMYDSRLCLGLVV